MGFDPSNIQQLGVGVSAFILTVTAVFLFTTAGRIRLARALGYLVIALIAWAWLGFASQLAQDLWLSRELRVISLIGETAALAFTVRFAYLYLSELRAPRAWERDVYRLMQLAGLCIAALLASDLFSTQLLVGAIMRTPQGVTLAPHAGPWFFWFLAYYLSVSAFVAVYMGMRILRERGAVRRAGLILGGSIVIAYLMGITGILPWYGIDNPLFGIPRALAAPFFVGAAFYSIASYRLFNIRIAAAEAFIFAIWGVLFFRALLHPTLSAALPDIVILLAVIALGFLMIRNVTRELATRVALEKVSKQLAALNGSLESKVATRTEELVRSERHIEQVIEHLPVALIEIDERGAMVRMNAAAEGLLGIVSASLAREGSGAGEKIAALLGRALTPGMFEVQVADSQRFVEVAIAPLTLEHGDGSVIIIRDITDKHALERAKDDFVATAAHQLRTPLAALKWTFDLLKSDALPPAQKEVVAQGAVGVANMERIAEALMLSIRTADGVMKYVFAEAPLAPLLEKCAAFIAPLAEKKQVTFTRDIDAALPSLSFDQARLEFAIENLLDNAIKYTPQGGTVTLSAHAAGGMVSITVTDNGVGISETDQAHLFEKFFRTAKGTEMFANGSGLGLSIAKSIIEAHGGSISVDSHEGGGSTFTIELPLDGVRRRAVA